MKAELHSVVSDPPSDRKWLLVNSEPLPGFVSPQHHWFTRKHLALQFAKSRGISVTILPLFNSPSQEQSHA